MAAQPVHNQSPYQADTPEADTVSGKPGVQAVEKRDSPAHVASPAHALQARIVSELSKPNHMSVRRVFATLLVLSLSTWLAGFILYAAL
jgi:cell pole-organizing protein PopZ